MALEKQKLWKTANTTFKSSHLTSNEQKLTPILRFICEFCQKGFSQSVQLTKHKYSHEEYTREYPIPFYEYFICHTGEKTIRCDHCEKEFTHYSKLTTHRQSHIGENSYKCELPGEA